MPDTYTPGQYTDVLDALGLDHDLTLAVTLTPGRVHVTTAAINPDGTPQIVGGVLQREEHSIPVE